MNVWTVTDDDIRELLKGRGLTECEIDDCIDHVAEALDFDGLVIVQEYVNEWDFERV